ncbi:MAG: alpha-hydroxy-acid oxidizing protein, partial [Actinomycetota bacterium]|nr:alpha-hydroxy-acid oxidizing protein [Actinomycetota bacterium]
VKALALGARAVGIGRGYLYPLLAAGEDGVDQMLRIFRNQIEQTLLWLGADSVQDLDRSYLSLPGRQEPNPLAGD